MALSRPASYVCVKFSGEFVHRVATQGLLLGAAGWVVASALTTPAVALIDQIAAAVVGYEDLLLVPNWLYGLGAAIGFGVGVGGAVIAGLLLTRLQTLQQLQR